MKKRFYFSLALCLSLYLFVSPLISLASNRKPTEPADTLALAARSAKPFRRTSISATKAYGKSLRNRVRQGSNSPSGQTVTLLADGRLLLIGGEGPNRTLNTAVISDPRINESLPVSTQLHHARSWHTATMLPDGTVLILGGIGEDGQVVEDAEVFDPETQKFENLAATGLTPRAYHTATLLTEGIVLIVGGTAMDGKLQKKAQIFDPQSRSVRTLKAKTKTARYGHSATLLANGNVLLRGGADKNGEAIESAEVYNQARQRFTKSDADIKTLSEMRNSQLEASLPKDREINVGVDRRIALRFSRPLRVETVNAETITLSSAFGTAEARIIPAEDGMLAFITPKALLLPGTTYILSLANLNDISNFTLANTMISFTTASPQAPTNFRSVDNEEWIPNENNLRGDWRSGRDDSPWRLLGPLQATPGVTALAGQALTLNGLPLAGVTLKIENEETQTDNTGRFLLAGIPAGHHELLIDGRSANRPGRTYGVFEVGASIEGGKTNVLSYKIWMPKIDSAHSVIIPSPTTSETVITTPRIPGLEVHIPPQTIIRDHEGNVATQISITPIPLDRTPFPLPEGVDVPIYFTVQPGGAYIHTYVSTGPKGARLIYPNYKYRPVGMRFDFWHYDPEERGWYIYGQGSVAEGGRQVVPDPDVSVYEFTGAMVASPSFAPQDGHPPGDCGWDGEPVSLSTGLFVMDKTDLVLPDVLPLTLTRTYRQRDNLSRAFGIGASHSFDLFLVGTTFPYTYIDLILPDGGRIHYDRISPGTSYEDAVYENTASPTSFHKTRIAWNGNGYNVTLKDGTVLSFDEGFDATRPGQGGLLKVKDRYDNVISISRDSNGNVTQIVSPNGRWMQFTNDTSNRITQARDNTGRAVNYTYDASGRLWKVTDPANGVTEYAYNTSNQMLTIKDARGIVFLTNEYDANGRVKKQIQADSTTYEFNYILDGNGKVTRTDVTDPRGNTRSVTFSLAGYTLTDTRGCCGGLVHTFERQAGTNFVLSDTDSMNRRTEYTYNPKGNLTSVTRLAGTGEAVTTNFTYEPTFNQVATVTDPLIHATQFGYDSKGSLTSITDPLNNQTTIAYNAAGQHVSVTDPLMNTTQIQYDAGDLTIVTNPLGQSVTRFIDSAGRMLSLTNAQGKSGRIEYDSLNQPTRVTDPLLGTTLFGYDPNGNLLTVTDVRNKAVSYSYDNMDRIATRTDPLLRQDVYLYNANGNLRQVTDRKNQVTSYSYDTLDRLTLITYADLSTTSYSYDNVNRLTSVVDSISGTISYGYDNMDRVTSETTQQGIVSYSYDAAGRRTSMTVSGQAVVNYTYDNADRLTQITQGSSTVAIGYDAANRRTSLTLPNGVLTEYGYNTASRLTSITYTKNAATLGNLTYEYDAAGRVNKLGGSFARTALPQPLSTTSYNSANQQTTLGAQTLTYDNNGNLTSDGINSYGWNARDQLVSMSGPGLVATFEYDPFSRRTSKTVNGASTSFVYDGADIVQEQMGAANASLLIGGLDELFTRTEATGTSTAIVGGLGNVIALTDSVGTLQTQYSYEPFGKTSATGVLSTNSSQYTGRENDAGGLYYNRARYYSPALQRFISEDPIGLAGGDTNLYAFVHNDPANSVDSSGLSNRSWYELGHGWTAGVDKFNSGEGFEIHLMNPQGKEVGICSGREGFLRKHGFPGTRPPNVPNDVINNLNGLNLKELRARQLVPPRGVARGTNGESGNVKGGSYLNPGRNLFSALNITQLALSLLDEFESQQDLRTRGRKNGLTPGEQFFLDSEKAGHPHYYMTPFGPMRNPYAGGRAFNWSS